MAGISCGSTVAKYLIFIFNVVFLLSGIVVLAIGAAALAKQPEYTTLVGTDVYSVAILLIVIGCLVTIICFFGCCGAIKENTCMLYTYSALLCVIFIMEFAGGIAAFVYREELKSSATEGMFESITAYDCVSQANTKEWDDLQKNSKCCGVNNATDWYKDTNTNCNFNSISQFVPWSCCDNAKPNTTGTCSYNSVSTKPGCLQITVDTLNSEALLLGGIAVGLAFIQILGIIFACCLAADLKH